jgi:hypothetical protein
MVGNSYLIWLRQNFAWACGPPIDMKINSSRSVYHQAGVGRQRSWQLWIK